MNSTDPLEERLRRCLPITARDAGDSTPLRELALDSIDTVDFLCAVHEEFGIRLHDSDFHPDQTLLGLISVVTAR